MIGATQSIISLYTPFEEEEFLVQIQKKNQIKNERRPLVGTVRRLGENALSTTEDRTPIITWPAVGTYGT